MNYKYLIKLVEKGIAKEIEGDGYKNYYVTKNGRVYSCSKKKGNSKVTKLTPQKNNKGYLRIQINGRSKLLHRLVALYFVPNINNYETVDHIDGNKLNNNHTNLQWCTNLENMRNARKNGLFKDTPLRKLSNKEVVDIRHRYKNEDITHHELADEYNVSRATIGAIIRRQLYKNIQ
ncbi:HNH homing endonuclease [Staphylococcus phage Twort]|uniref:HNH homing endonuclease n=2 Tax=Staphylococcus phage Twort (strain DSM 17442 / HER 48) TaxID=2908167 RepID=A0A6H0X567_BPTWO|nr:HNH endonuclease [Staphylococcus phage Twort]AAX92364.1 ORF069 [Staphylococcus phage Twort]QIW89074.1 HNH homing endonuclease [Staphylococcus phage Twort]